MPKPPPVEYFEFICRTEVAHAGPIMAQLTKIEGLDVSAPKLVSEIRAFAKNERTNHNIKAEDYLIDWIASHPEFRANEAIKHFRADGRTDGAGYTALRMLVERKLLRKLGEGRYTTLAKKHQPKGLKAAKKAKAAKKVRGAARKQNDISNAEFIRRAMSRAHGRMSSATIKRLFEADKRVPTGVGPTITKMRENGVIKALGEGMYELVKPKVNGAAVATTTGV